MAFVKRREVNLPTHRPSSELATRGRRIGHASCSDEM
ncbi:unnamed protein product [Brassica oleracea var. botrytis]